MFHKIQIVIILISLLKDNANMRITNETMGLTKELSKNAYFVFRIRRALLPQ